MLEFFRAMKRNGSLAYQLPAMTAAFLIAEFFYKFRSFALECLAFLATWYLIDVVVDVARRAWPRERRSVDTP